jgi:hypothetical protein
VPYHTLVGGPRVFHRKLQLQIAGNVKGAILILDRALCEYVLRNLLVLGRLLDPLLPPYADVWWIEST